MIDGAVREIAQVLTEASALALLIGIVATGLAVWALSALMMF